MNDEMLFFYVPGVDGGTAALAKVQNADRMKEIMEELGAMQAWAEANAGALLDAPAGLQDSVRCLELGEGCGFSELANCTVDEGGGTPVLEFAGRPFDPDMPCLLTQQEANDLLLCTAWHDPGAGHAKQSFALMREDGDPACGMELSIDGGCAYASLEDMRAACGSLLEESPSPAM